MHLDKWESRHCCWGRTSLLLGACFLLSVLVITFGLQANLKLVGLFILGILLGITLLKSVFGFSAAYRRAFLYRDLRAVKAQLLMLLLGTCLCCSNSGKWKHIWTWGFRCICPPWPASNRRCVFVWPGYAIGRRLWFRHFVYPRWGQSSNVDNIDCIHRGFVLGQSPYVLVVEASFLADNFAW